MVFCLLVARIRFLKESGINRNILVGLFTLKIAAGLAYAWFYSLPGYKPNSDTFRFFDYSLQETDVLLHHPIAFVKDVFTHGYAERGNLFIGENSYWNDLKSNIIIKLLAVCNVCTLKNYYADIIFFNFLFLFGLVAFYKVMNELFSNKKMWIVMGVFCMPSFLFWCSGIHKDGLIFSSIGLTIFYFYRSLQVGFRLKYVIGIILNLAFIFLLRNYVCLLFIQALFTYWLAEKQPRQGKRRPLLIFSVIYFIGIIGFLLTSQLDSKFNALNYLSLKQHEFAALGGGSGVRVESLQPTVESFIGYFPTAVDMALLRPHFSEIKNKSYLPAVAESWMLILLLLICIPFKKKGYKIPPIIWACWFFALSMLLIEGYTITFSGAIIRYKSLALPLIIAPLFGMIDWKRFKNNTSTGN